MGDEAEFAADQITQTKTSDASKKRRSESTVWEEFTKLSNGQQAECKHCLKRLSGKSTGGTSHLSRHLKICPARPGNTSKQPQAPEAPSRPTVSNLCSFPIMSSAGFRQALAGIYHPTSSMIPQNVTEGQFITMFRNERLKLKDKIASATGGVFLSVRRWDLEESIFECLAVHFIDAEWKIHRRIIRYRLSMLGHADPGHYISIFPIRQNSSHPISVLSKETVVEYSLMDKLLGIALEHLTDVTITGRLENILTGKNYLLAKCKLITMQCSVDVLHRIFGYELNDVILETGQKWLSYMTCSPLRSEKYQQLLSHMCLPRPSLASVMWYPTFYLMEALLEFNKEFPNPEQMDSKSYPPKPPFETIEAAESFCQVARPIYHAIRVLSNPRMTLNSCFHALWSVRAALQESSGNICMERVLDIEDMLETFDKHWRKVYLWLSLAVVLDPRYKMRFLEHFFRQAYGNGARMYISEMRGKIYELFIRYSCCAEYSCQ